MDVIRGIDADLNELPRNENSLYAKIKSLGFKLEKGFKEPLIQFYHLEKALILFRNSYTESLENQQLKMLLSELKKKYFKTASKNGVLQPIHLNFKLLNWLSYRICLHCSLNNLLKYYKANHNLNRSKGLPHDIVLEAYTTWANAYYRFNKMSTEAWFIKYAKKHIDIDAYRATHQRGLNTFIAGHLKVFLQKIFPHIRSGLVERIYGKFLTKEGSFKEGKQNLKKLASLLDGLIIEVADERLMEMIRDIHHSIKNDEAMKLILQEQKEMNDGSKKSRETRRTSAIDYSHSKTVIINGDSPYICESTAITLRSPASSDTKSANNSHIQSNNASKNSGSEFRLGSLDQKNSLFKSRRRISLDLGSIPGSSNLLSKEIQVPSVGFSKISTISPNINSGSRVNSSPKIDSDSKDSPSPNINSGSKTTFSPKIDIEAHFSFSPDFTGPNDFKTHKSSLFKPQAAYEVDDKRESTSLVLDFYETAENRKQFKSNLTARTETNLDSARSNEKNSSYPVISENDLSANNISRLSINASTGRKPDIINSVFILGSFLNKCRRNTESTEADNTNTKIERSLDSASEELNYNNSDSSFEDTDPAEKKDTLDTGNKSASELDVSKKTNNQWWNKKTLEKYYTKQLLRSDATGPIKKFNINNIKSDVADGVAFSVRKIPDDLEGLNKGRNACCNGCKIF